MRKGIILVLVLALCPFVLAGGSSNLDPELLRQRVIASVGSLPWNLSEGYVLDGQFTLKAMGEETQYRAKYARSAKKWAADFSQEDASRNLRYAGSGNSAWVSSPEISTDISSDLIPYMAGFDFLQLYSELLRILERGKGDPFYDMASVSNEILVRGRLQNGGQAVFVLNTVEFFPRKVQITTISQTSAAWLIPYSKPNGSCSLLRVPGWSSEFELWFSDPVAGNGYKFPKRTDFVENGNVVGTFIQENSDSFSGSEAIFKQLPSATSTAPEHNSPRQSFYLDDSELSAFRARMETEPWAGWYHMSRVLALWATVSIWVGPLLPGSLSLRLIFFAVALIFLGFFLVLWRRCRQHQVPFRWSLAAAGLVACCVALVAGSTSPLFHSSQHRSLFALHSAIRYTVTGNSSDAKQTDRLLRGFLREAPAHSMEELGYSCQAYALAYDLIRRELSGDQREEIETDLMTFAKPLYGAAHGWASNTDAGSVLSAGLGMAGLAAGCEPFIRSASEVARKMLETQLQDGSYQAGPGPGVLAFDSAANFFYGLQHSGRENFFAHPAFHQYLSSALQTVSPVGTLPLFEETNLPGSARLSRLFLKAANQLPEEEGRQCVAAHNLYWNYGQYSTEGWVKWIMPILHSWKAYFENPYVLFQYHRSLPPSFLPASSAVLGRGQLAILRTGNSPDAVYVALNARKASLTIAHRDILSFDLYAYRSLLLHGPGFPGKNDRRYKETTQTAAGNSVTLNNESQSRTQCAGIQNELINQPIFDYVRILADRTYDFGQVQRDVVLVRPEKDHPAYLFLLDDVLTAGPDTIVKWYLHGGGELVTGIDQVARWTSARFSPSRWRVGSVSLEASHPAGGGNQSTGSGKLYSGSSFADQDSKSIVIEWRGSKRFPSVLFPYTGSAPKTETIGKDSARIGTDDWFSLGNLRTRLSVGPLTHVSEYVLVRDRAAQFPALLMVSGQEFRFGEHSLSSTKPITISLDGLSGGFLNKQPDTLVEIHSPQIRKGAAFLLDGHSIEASAPGILIVTLIAPGRHQLEQVR
jgi:hypothetical protein